MRSLRSILRLEGLSVRVLPSTLAATAPLAAGHAAVVREVADHAQSPAHHAHHHADRLHGDGHGGFRDGPKTPDAGREFLVNGKAFLAAMGDVTVTGTVWKDGHAADGRAGGLLTFRDSGGSVTVELTGPVQAANAHLPHEFTYKVIDGTGAYAHFHDHGTLTLALHHVAGEDGGTFHLHVGGGGAVKVN